MLGYSVGDFIAVLQLANEIRERFVDAPEQFKTISKEVTGLSNVLRDIEGFLSLQGLTDWQEKALVPILEGCHNILIALGKVVDENYCLKPSINHNIRDKSRKIWKRLTWNPDDIQELRSRVTLNVSLLNTFNGSLISKATLATKNSVDRLHERQDNREGREERQAILDWLTPIDYASQQSDFFARQQKGTGQWLLESAKYQGWLKNGKQTLFCPGIPGAGKTILTSIVVDFLYKRFQGDSKTGIAYLYCNFRQQGEQKAEDLLASLLKQLSQEGSSLPDPITSLYDNHKQNRTRPSFDDISRSLHAVAILYSRVFIIIDALDEYQVSDGSRTRFLSEMFSLQAKCGANLLVTSRYVPDITERFKQAIILEIRASSEDVRRYLSGHMFRLPGFVVRSPEIQEEVKTKIIQSVQGMFLLAQLHLDSLIGKRSAKVFRNALTTLPTGSDAYDHAYKDAMDRIEGQVKDQVELAKQILSWITCAKRPFTTSELQHALAVEIGEPELDEENLSEIDDMVSVCAGLVTVDEESKIIRLVHYTTQEYFERTQKHWFPDVETDITKICVTYLLFDTFQSGFRPTIQEFVTRLQENVFYEYAARNWGYHARAASTKVEQLTLNFLESEEKVLAAGQSMIASFPGFSQRVPGQLTGFHLAAYFELNEAIIALLKNGHHPDSKDNYGQTPLSWAAENGHEAVVGLLINKGAELESKDIYGQTPLLWATRNGHEAVVRLLLERGAKLESKDNYGRTILLWAARKGHEVLVRLLLEKGADLESGDNKSHPPLLWAARNGHEAVVRLLLENGAEFESKDNDGRTPLWWAVRRRHEAVEKLLLEKAPKKLSI